MRLGGSDRRATPHKAYGAAPGAHLEPKADNDTDIWHSAHALAISPTSSCALMHLSTASPGTIDARFLSVSGPCIHSRALSSHTRRLPAPQRRGTHVA